MSFKKDNRFLILEFVHNLKFEGPGGGIGRFTIDLCRNLDVELFNVTLYSLWNYNTKSEKEIIQQLKGEGISTFNAADWNEKNPYHSFWNAYINISEFYMQNPMDLIHSHSEFSDVVALMIKLRWNNPKILRTVHYGYKHEWRNKPLRRLLFTNLLFPVFYDKEVGVSQTVTNTLNRRPLAKVLKHKGVYVSSAIDLNRFINKSIHIEDIKSDLNIPENSLVIGTVGRLSEQKGYTYLIDAAPIVLREIPNAHFLIIGNGELLSELQNQAKDLGISNNFTFTGGRTDIENLFHSMDLFVSSSLWEGLPAVIMESMAAGVPVVATNINGTRDLIENGRTGWLVPPSNPNALGQTMINAVHSTTKKFAVIKNAKYFVKQYSMKFITKQYQDLYLSLVNKS